MKINETQRVQSISAYQKSELRRSTASKQAARRDEVHISQEAKEILLQQSGGTQQADNAKKLGQLKESIASGKYRVDSDKLAERMLPFLLSGGYRSDQS